MEHQTHSKALSETEYNLARTNPQPGDSLYLHLLDLSKALENFRSDESLTILDYGCGGSPYRHLFPNSSYRRADYIRVPDLDYLLEETGTVCEKSETFDLILSTQVMEHLRDPAKYLDECHRLLKPGGRLICTTHGIYQEHGCPYDFQRWTPAGLRRDLENAGFQVIQNIKLTLGPRALIMLINVFLGTLRAQTGWFASLCLRTLRWTYYRNVARINKWADQHLQAFSRQTAGDLAEHSSALYLAILIEARKSVSTNSHPKETVT